MSLVKTGLGIIPSAVSHSANFASFLTLLRISAVYRIKNRFPKLRLGESNGREELTVRLHGARFGVHVRWNRGDPYSLVEVMLGDEYFRYLRYLPGGLKIRTIVDLGANIGMFSLLCAAMFPGADIYAVEPDGENIDMLRQNLADIKTATARWLRGAAWIYDGETTLVASDRSTEHSLIAAEERKGTVTVPCYTVDSIFRKAGFTGIDLLKVDIEGAEREILSGCESWISKVSVIVIELHPVLTGFDIKKLKAKLEPLGFVVFEKRLPLCANTASLTGEEIRYLSAVLA
jgi:FkbM family methyltransferase